MADFSLDKLLGFLQQNGINTNMVIYIFVGILALFVVLYLLIKILRKPQEAPPRRIDTGTPPSKRSPAPSPESASPAAPTPSAPAEASAPPPAPPPAEPVESAAPVAKPAVVVAAATAPIQAAPPAPAAFGAHVPQDSVLRRHYLAEAQRMGETVAGPCPADSVLRRHHRHLVQSRLEACLGDAARMDQLRAEYAARQAVPAPEPVAVAAIAPEAAVAAPAPVAAPSEAKPQTVRIPEDSILRRHFLNHVRHLLEKAGPGRPTDSVLRRHYEHHIGNELKACLRDPARIARLLGYSARQA